MTSDRVEDLGAVLVGLVQALFPVDRPVYPRTLYGLTTFPLYLVNTVLERYGYVLHATKTRVATRFVSCLDKHGRTEPYGLFELRHIGGGIAMTLEKEDANGEVGDRIRVPCSMWLGGH